MRQAKLLLLPRSRKRGSGAQSAGYGRFGECRGEAPEGERAPVWRASAPVHCRTVTSASVARTVDGMRLSALRLPLYEPEASLKKSCCRGRRQSSDADGVARTNFFTLPLQGPGGGGSRPRRGAGWGEGDQTNRMRIRIHPLPPHFVRRPPPSRGR